MKKLLSIVLLILLVLLSVSCGNNSAKTPADNVVNYPTRDIDNFIDNDNETGMTYKFTLDKFTTEFNTMYSQLGGDYKDFPYKNWSKRAREKQSNGKFYNYLYLTSKYVVLTATEEAETRRLVNVGCGITEKKLKSNKKIKNKVMTICGVMAAAAGGYNIDSVKFFGNLFNDTISFKDHSLWYEDSIYVYDKETASDGTKTILFRTMPALPNIKDDWKLQDYREYKNEK